MNPWIPLAAVAAMIFATLRAESIVYDFNDGDGAADSNSFGASLVAGDFTFDVDAGGAAFQNGRAESGIRDDGAAPTPYPVNRFTVTVPAGTVVDLTSLEFDYGFNETVHPNAITPYWELSVSSGSASPDLNSLGEGTVDSVAHFQQGESVALSGLTGLTDTTVTFEFTLRTEEARNNSLARAHTLDNITLNGSIAAAGTVTWSTPAATTDESVISLAGTLVRAVNFTRSDADIVREVTVGAETIAFQPDTDPTDNGAGWTTNGTPVNNLIWNNQAAGSFFEVMRSFHRNTDPGDATLVIGGLTPGETYQIQLFYANEGQTSFPLAPMDVAAGNTVRLDPGYLGGIDGGENVIGTFTADGTSLTLTLSDSTGGGVEAVNACVLRHLGGAPRIVSFSADRSVVDAGGTVTLFWQVEDADSVALSPGIGDATSLTTGGAGSTTVTVAEATTFTLTASNDSGSDSADVRVALRPDAPNILIVLVDDMGTEDTSVDFNYDQAGDPLDRIDPTSVGLRAFTQDNRHFRTPNMEALAASGMIFSRAYASQVCSPTRCTLLTGQNAARHGTHQYLGGGGSQNNVKAPPNPGLTAANRTLAEVMRDAGYRTIVAGKGHIGSAFNGNVGNYKTPAPPASDYYGFQVNVSATNRGAHGNCYANAATAFGLSTSGIEGPLVAEYQDKTYHDIDPAGYPVGHAFADLPVFVTEAITREMIERIEDSVEEGLPFLAYLPHYAVHDPHQTDPRFSAHYPGLSGEVLAFATMIEGMDQSLGDILGRLDELGIAEDTLVVFMGDNGSDSKPRGGSSPTPTLSMTNPLRGEKGMRYEGGLRVPLIVSWAKPDPGNPYQQAFPVASGARTNDIVSAQDIFPTVLAATGIPLPAVDDAGAPLVIDGVDLGPYLAGQPGHHRPQTFLNHAPCSSRSSFFTTWHDGDWKLIYSYVTSSPDISTALPLGSFELYDLATDIHEANNLAASEPARVMTMARAMVASLEAHGAPYPILKAYDADLAGLGLPANTDDVHPVILPESPGVDVDGDGLDDNAEDPNRNGLVDPGETDPANENTDGDRTPDGAEARTGTNPLDPSDDFRLAATMESGNSLLLSWPSKPGASYQILATEDLLHWPAAPLAAVDAAAAGNLTTYEVPMGTADQQFFRVLLLP
ncbi:MAG: sulfatase-like hydrolase/transferase [Akkermansiaceae bacterium]|nr:sulfatase-like hydrolase/transferase [Akkermansiaceae bacterium]